MTKRSRRAALFGAIVAVCPLIHAGTARADLLTLERWATNQGLWINPSTWLEGDFDGNGKSDLAFVWQPDQDDVAISYHLSCDNNAILCPPGVPNSTQSGAFVLPNEINNPQNFATLPDDCTSNSCPWVGGAHIAFLSGDFDDDGKTDVAVAYKANGQITTVVWPSEAPVLGQTILPTPQNWPTQGAWADNSQWVSGDFDGDGKDDLAYIFEVNGGIDIDVHHSTGSATTGFQLEHWAVNQGAWPANRVFLASDLNGDGLTDIALAFEVNGLIYIDAHLATKSGCPASTPNNCFTLEHWATGQGSWITGGAGFAQWTSVPGLLQRPGLVPGVGLIDPFFTTAPGNGLGGAGLGDLIYAFNSGGNIQIDGHLANDTPVPGGGASGEFNLQRYASNQGTYPQNVQFLGGDYNRDLIGDVADPFEVNGLIDIDVHRGNCQGPLADSGQCCPVLTNVCNGDCCAGTCSTGVGAVNGCCPFGQTCPPPIPR